MPRRTRPDLVSHVALEADADIGWRDRLFLALYYLGAFGLLGVLVSFRPPNIIDGFARPFAGNGVSVAWAVTQLGRFPAYVTIAVLLLVFGFIKREYMRAVLISIVTLLVAWFTSDAFKSLFNRPRPTYWHVFREPSAAYPSGHATLVVAFYGFWTAVAWSANIGRAAKRWIRIAFAMLALAVGWARLALGAHFLTDVIGGYLLGAGIASLAIMVYRLVGSGEPAEA